MTPERAEFIAHATADGHADQYPAGELAQAYDIIADRDAYLAEAMVEAAPGIVNYDYRGNWIGAVAGENGWTA